MRALGAVSKRLISYVNSHPGVLGEDVRRELCGLSNDVCKRLMKLADAGRIHRRLDGSYWRYFGSQQAAHEWDVAQGRVVIRPVPPPVVGFAQLGIGRYLEA